MKQKQKTKALVVSLVMILIIFLGQFVYAEIKEQDIAHNLGMAEELAKISGLTDETVMKIYEAISSWDKVSENIFIYRKILSFVSEETEEYVTTVAYFGQYGSDDLLAIFEYLYINGKSTADVDKILKKLDKGEELENILSIHLAEGEYTVYTSATKKDIRKWLAKGYTPQEIINADHIAMEKDMNLDDMLYTYLTTTDEAISMETTISEAIELIIKTESTEKKISAKDYKTLVNDMKVTADKLKADQIDKILQQYEVDRLVFQKYKEKGLNIYEIENAYRLAKKDEAIAVVILSERLSGIDWEDLILKYSQKEIKKDEQLNEILEADEGDGE